MNALHVSKMLTTSNADRLMSLVTSLPCSTLMRAAKPGRAVEGGTKPNRQTLSNRQCLQRGRLQR